MGKYLDDFQLNNEQLQEILDIIEKLPDIPSVEQATPSISVDSAGLITASATQTAGYVVAGTKSATKAIPSTYKRMATGTVTADSDNTVTVTGLGFTPSDVCLMSQSFSILDAAIVRNGTVYYATTSGASTVTVTPTFSSGGFKIKRTYTTGRISGTYYYVAWA